MHTPAHRSSLRARAFALIGGAAVVAGGCAPPSAAEHLSVSPSPEPALCQLVPPPSRMTDSLWIAATGGVIPLYAPNAHTLAERVVFPLLYFDTNCAALRQHRRWTGVAAAVPPQVELTDRDTAVSRELVVHPLRPRIRVESEAGAYEIAAGNRHCAPSCGRAKPSTGPHVHFSAIDDEQGRDAIDAGADMVLTSDPRTIALRLPRNPI